MTETQMKNQIEEIKNKLDNIRETNALQGEYADNIKYLANKALHGYFLSTENQFIKEPAFKELKAIVNMINDYINLIIGGTRSAGVEIEKLFKTL